MRPTLPRRDTFAEDCRGTLMGLLAYVGALALIGSVLIAAAAPLADIAITAATDAFAGRINLASDAGAEVVSGSEGERQDAAPRSAPGTRSFGLRGAI